MNVLEHFKDISTFVFDVDGVMTDGRVLLLENGLQARMMNIKDGLALQMALNKNYNVVVISGGSSDTITQRLQYLGVKEIHLGIKDKVKFLENFLEHARLQWSTLLYMGDDLPDVPVLQKAALPCCPSDAVMEVKKISKYISPLNGGYGCVRDVIEKVLKLNDHWHYTTEVSSR